MFNIPALRWGKPYESLETIQLTHFLTGEPVANLSQVNGSMLSRDMRFAQRARDVLRDLSSEEIINRFAKAADLYLNGTLAIGDGQQSPEQFALHQSSTTGIPVPMCRANMQKNFFVMTHMGEMLDALTRGLDLRILSRGWGREQRNVVVSYQVQSPVIGLVLPSNSPGVHTLWLPVLPLQVGLVLKPGSQEPWTPYRLTAAFTAAGIPPEAISIFPGGHDVGGALLSSCQRSMIFGGLQTIEKYRGDPRVAVHGPGFTKILLGDDVVDDWERYLDLMVESVYANSGRGCINASGIWASRHTKEIAAAIARRIGPVEALPPDDPRAGLAAFTVPNAAQGVWRMIEADLAVEGVTHMTAEYGPRLVERERCAYLRPTVVHCASPALPIANKEFMFPFVSVVECPQEKMLESIGYTLIATAITNDARWQQQLTDATHIDRLNIGPIPTTKLDWLQPHEGNIVEFLFKARAYQVTPERLAAGV